MEGMTPSGPDADAEQLPLQTFLPYRLSVLSLEIGRSLASLYSERFDLTNFQWRVMANLGRHQPLAANEIVERTGMDKVCVSRAVGGLLAKGLVSRQTDERDRRRKALMLTAKGMEIYRRIVPLAKARSDEILTALTPGELDSLNDMLTKLHVRVRDVAGREKG